MRVAFLVTCLLSSGCVVKSLCPEGYEEEGSLDCKWDFCRRNPEDSHCVDAAAPDGSVEDAAADGAGSDGGSVDAHVAECSRSADCSADAPRCLGGECVRCASGSDCAGRAATPACDSVTGACVECTEASQALCTTDEAVCMLGGNQCVECNNGNDCDEVAPRCNNADNTCGQCVTNEDCGRWGKVCSTGQCVQCTPQGEQLQCPDADPAVGDQGPACDPVAKTCTGKPRGSVSGCGACVSDSECVDGAACVQTTFKGAVHGKFCLAEVANASDVCPQQTNKNRAAVSVLGHPGQFCFPDTSTTCEAILEFGAGGCGAEDNACGADGLADGLCRANKCTYVCGAADDCFGSTSTDNKCVGVGTKYCNPN